LRALLTKTQPHNMLWVATICTSPVFFSPYVTATLYRTPDYVPYVAFATCTYPPQHLVYSRFPSHLLLVACRCTPAGRPENYGRVAELRRLLCLWIRGMRPLRLVVRVLAAIKCAGGVGSLRSQTEDIHGEGRLPVERDLVNGKTRTPQSESTMLVSRPAPTFGNYGQEQVPAVTIRFSSLWCSETLPCPFERK